MRQEIKFEDLVHFTNKQKFAQQAIKDNKYILFGGSMGGGKSYWLRWALVDLLTDWAKEGHKGVRVGLFCEDYPALKDRHLSKIQYEFPEWLGQLNKADYEFKLAEEYGAGVICFRNLDDPSKYQSAEFAAIAVDELTKNKKETFDFLRTRLRWPGVENTKFLAGSNPGGIGHGWVKKLWMDKVFEPTEKEAHLFYFIPAKATDNPHLSGSYFTSLEGLPAEMRKAFVEGDWNIFKGQYFTEWRTIQHTCPPFPIPKTWRKFRAYDYGREKPACCLWFALDYDGRVFCYREFYKAGLNVDQQAAEINRLSGDETYQWSVADSAIFTRTGITDSKGSETIAQNFARHNIVFFPATKQRVPGWTLFHQYLFWNENTQPKIIFFNHCHNAIRTIPELIYDERNVEDVDSESEDHLADVCRYFLTALKEQATEKPKTEMEQWLDKKREQESAMNFSEYYSGAIYRREIK